MLELKYFKIQKGDNTTPNIIKNWHKFNIMLLEMETSNYNHISTEEFHLIRI
jgi:uridine phosphorylase